MVMQVLRHPRPVGDDVDAELTQAELGGQRIETFEGFGLGSTGSRQAIQRRTGLPGSSWVSGPVVRPVCRMTPGCVAVRRRPARSRGTPVSSTELDDDFLAEPFERVDPPL